MTVITYALHKTFGIVKDLLIFILPNISSPPHFHTFNVEFKMDSEFASILHVVL